MQYTNGGGAVPRCCITKRFEPFPEIQLGHRRADAKAEFTDDRQNTERMQKLEKNSQISNG